MRYLSTESVVSFSVGVILKEGISLRGAGRWGIHISPNPYRASMLKYSTKRFARLGENAFNKQINCFSS